jgi:hypothetical protein
VERIQGCRETETPETERMEMMSRKENRGVGTWEEQSAVPSKHDGEEKERERPRRVGVGKKRGNSTQSR